MARMLDSVVRPGLPSPLSRPGTLTKAALSIGTRGGEYDGGLREDILGKTTFRAEKEGRRAALRAGDGIPQGRVGRPRLHLRQGEGPLSLQRRSVRLLPRARRLGSVEDTGSDTVT